MSQIPRIVAVIRDEATQSFSVEIEFRDVYRVIRSICVPRALVDTRCPAGTNATIDVSLAVVHGPYTGSTGHLEECIDFSGLSDGIVRGVSVGPVVI